MEAGPLLRRHIPLNLLSPPPRRRFPSFRPSVRAFSNSQGARKPIRELIADWVSSNDDVVRPLPVYVGGISLLAVLFNRTLSGIAPVADASSSQSRADLLTLGLAVTNILTGLVWLSIRPKTISVVNPEGLECQRISTDQSDAVAAELLWSLVIVYDNRCVLQIGFAAASPSCDDEPLLVDVRKLMQGSLYQNAIQSGSQSYLANLSLYPGKSQLPFLPSNTQAVILQPLGDKGIAIMGGNTIRGFTTSDQAWITLTGDKLDATLAKHFSSGNTR